MIANALNNSSGGLSTAMSKWGSNPFVPNPITGATRVILDRADHIDPEPIQFLWHGFLALGKFHLLAGSPGTGKSGIAISFAAAVSGSFSSYFPDRTRPQIGDVVIWASEDNVEDTIIPRLLAAGADMSRIHIVRGTIDKGISRPFRVEDCQRLREVLTTIGGVKLLIIDPITQVVRKNANSNTEVRNSLESLLALAEQHKFAILGIAHLAKGSRKKAPLERILGSVAFAAVARVAMMTLRGNVDDEDDEDAQAPCVLVRVKSNIGPDGGGFAYEIQPATLVNGPQTLTTSSTKWGEYVPGSPKSIFEIYESESDSGSTKLAKAKQVLHDILKGGRRIGTDATNDMKSRGFSGMTIRRAREDLNVALTRLSDPQGVFRIYWSLSPEPPFSRATPSDQPRPCGPSNWADFAGTPADSGIFVNPPESRFPFGVGSMSPDRTASPWPAGRAKNHDQVDHLDHLGTVPNEHVEQVEQQGAGFHGQKGAWTHETDEEMAANVEIPPSVDQGLLAQVIAQCCRARDALPEMLKSDEVKLDEIERAALNDLVHPGEQLLFRQALQQSDWLFL